MQNDFSASSNRRRRAPARGCAPTAKIGRSAMKIAAAIALSVLPLFADALPGWNFTGGKVGPWTRPARLTATPTAEGLRLDLTGRDSNIIAFPLDLDPKKCGGIAVTYRAEGFTSPTTGQVFFATKADPKYDGRKQLDLPPLVCDGEWHTIALDADDVRGGRRLWVNGGRIVGLRLDLADQFPGRITLRSVKMLPLRRSGGGDLPVWDFSGGRIGPWKRTLNLTATPTVEGLRLDLGKWDSHVATIPLKLDPEKCGGIAVTYRAEGFTSQTTGQIFFVTKAEPKYDGRKKIDLPSLLYDGNWHTIELDARQVRGGRALWTDGGPITGLRLDMADQFPGRVTLRSVRMLPPRPSRAARSGMPESRRVELNAAKTVRRNRFMGGEAPVFSSPMTAPANGGFDHAGHCYLRREFELDGPVRTALLQTVCDDEIAELYVNGRRVEYSWSNKWHRSDRLEIPAEYFKIGKNLIAVDYLNYGDLGGLMLDLQMMTEDGSYVLVTAKDSRGTVAEPPADWMKVETSVDWPLAETRPGAPHPPWCSYPTYRSIRPGDAKLAVEATRGEGSSIEAVLRGEPALTDDSRIYAKLFSGANCRVLVHAAAGTLRELGAVRQEDGSYRVRFDDAGKLRYGAAVDAAWEFGMKGREARGDTFVKFRLGDRPMPGAPAVLRIERTPNGPVAMLNGKPFYFNILRHSHFQIPTGMEGPKSPFNIIMTSAGGWLEEWWLGPGKYDFSAVDRQLNFALANYPNAMLGLGIWCQPGLWYGRMYPERLSRDERGKVPGNTSSVPSLSFSDPDWRADAKEALDALVRHCEKYFGPRMVLYNLLGGYTSEWQGWTSQTPFFSDYSEGEARRFVAYAARQGRTVTGVPSHDERVAAAPGGIFRDPVRDWKAILYDRYYNEEMAESVVALAAAAKAACRGDKLVGTYFGYLMEYSTMGYAVNAGGHNDLRALLDSPDVDFLCSPQSYRLRSLGGPNAEMKPFGSIREAGKLSLIEDDTRTNMTGVTNYDQTLNLEDTLAVLERNIATYLANGMPLWQVPLRGGNELDHPAIRRIFLRALKAGQYLYAHPETDVRAEIAAVTDADSISYLAAVNARVRAPETNACCYNAKGKFVDYDRWVLPVSGEMLSFQRWPLGRCGAPVDWLMLEDVPRLAGKYKLVILLGAYADTPKLRAALAALKAAGTKVLVVYGAGFIDPDKSGFSASAMNELLGMKIDIAKPGSIKVGFPDGRTAGADYMTHPRFRVADPGATVLAHYANDRKLVAAAMKDNAVFYGGALLDANLVRKIAREAGVHIYNETEDNLTAGNGIVSIHCSRPGVKTVRFPKATDVVDLCTGEVLGRNVAEVRFPMKAFETRVLVTGDAAGILAALDDGGRANGKR